MASGRLPGSQQCHPALCRGGLLKPLCPVLPEGEVSARLVVQCPLRLPKCSACWARMTPLWAVLNLPSHTTQGSVATACPLVLSLQPRRSPSNPPNSSSSWCLQFVLHPEVTMIFSEYKADWAPLRPPPPNYTNLKEIFARFSLMLT